MKTDIQIAQEAVLQPIEEVAKGLGLTRDELEFYGKYKAKISDEYIDTSVVEYIKTNNLYGWKN